MFQKSEIGSFITGEQTKPFLFMGFPEGKPFIELVPGDAKSFTEQFDGIKPGKVFPKDTQDKEQAVAAVRNDGVRKDGMGMITAVTEDPEDTQVILFVLPCPEINDGTPVVVMYVAVSGASTDGTGLQLRLKMIHVGIKKRF